MTVLQDWISAIEDWVPMLAESLWVYPALMLFATVDGFFPPVPSESVVIALASLSVAQGSPNIVLVALAAAAGAFLGDQIAYLIGSRVDVHRLRVFRSPRGRRTLAWAEHALAHRGSSFILAARYIPIGRVAVNMTAGALGYPRRRFVGLTALAAVTWAAYGSLVGAGAGIWLEDHPVIAVVAGVVVGTMVGIGIDWVLRRWTGLDKAPVPMAATGDATTEPVTEPGDAAAPSTPSAGTPSAGTPSAGTPSVGTASAGTASAGTAPSPVSVLHPATVSAPPAPASRAPLPVAPAQRRVTSRQRSGPAR